MVNEYFSILIKRKKNDDTSRIEKKGYQILVEHLRQVDAIRFLQQPGWGSGDYTQERKETLDKVTREEFWQALQWIRSRNVD